MNEEKNTKKRGSVLKRILKYIIVGLILFFLLATMNSCAKIDPFIKLPSWWPRIPGFDWLPSIFYKEEIIENPSLDDPETPDVSDDPENSGEEDNGDGDKDINDDINEDFFKATFYDGNQLVAVYRADKEGVLNRVPRGLPNLKQVFMGWYLDPNESSFKTAGIVLPVKLVSDVVYYAIYRDRCIVEISFEVDGDIFDVKNTDPTGRLSSFPEEPKKEGYVFLGWYINDEYVGSHMVFNEASIVSARWKEKVGDETGGGAGGNSGEEGESGGDNDDTTGSGGASVDDEPSDIHIGEMDNTSHYYTFIDAPYEEVDDLFWEGGEKIPGHIYIMIFYRMQENSKIALRNLDETTEIDIGPEINITKKTWREYVESYEWRDIYDPNSNQSIVMSIDEDTNWVLVDGSPIGGIGKNGEFYYVDADDEIINGVAYELLPNPLYGFEFKG